MNQVYLSRRNLESLLRKLDRVRAGEESACTIVKNDTVHSKYPATVPMLYVTAVEDADYYTDRTPGPMYEDQIKGDSK